VAVYVYPTLQEGSEEVMNAANLPVPDGVKFLYQHLLNSKQIIDIQHFTLENLHIYSKEVLRLIRHDEAGWDKMVPDKIAQLIREKYLFSFPAQRMTFDY
jgi:hypothetical protein